MNNITKVSASDLKNNTSEILNMVAYGGYEAIVERYGEDFVRILPILNTSKVKKDYKLLLNKYYGSDPDFPEVYKNRLSKKHVKIFD